MHFIETPTFTRQITELLSDEEYARLQTALMQAPEAGDLITGGGGIRKLRWARTGTGKSGGIRTIYFFRKSADEIHMLCAYPKSAQETTSAALVAALRHYVKEL